MIFLPLASVVLSYLLKRAMEQASDVEARSSMLLASVIFICGVYLLGAGYGDHEVTNYLHERVCPQDETTPLCLIIIYNDDSFSHYVFFIGFILMNAALMIVQHLQPRNGSATSMDLALIAINALFIAAGIFANLAFEEIGLDLYVVALLSVLALYLLFGTRRPIGRVPILLYFALAFTLSTVATAIVKIGG
jgi:hypothetical protein